MIYHFCELSEEMQEKIEESCGDMFFYNPEKDKLFCLSYEQESKFRNSPDVHGALEVRF